MHIKKIYIILISNYSLDRQESMNRFSEMLYSGFCEAGMDCEIWRPKVFFGKLVKSTSSGLGKWIGYLDKWIIFPLLLRMRLRKNTLRNYSVKYHICDHSNAPYIKQLPSSSTSITCHDVLAIRGALGFADAHCKPSGLGKILQKWILHHLLMAKKVICVSQATLKQLNELGEDLNSENRGWRVIHIGFNNHFKPINKNDATLLLHKAGYKLFTPFLLHVGSGLPRKNRRLLIDMLIVLGDRWTGNICFAGEVIDNTLLKYVQTHGLSERVISIVKPDHNTLVSLYSTCEAFIFPSYSEGFGWPLIEAQACGAPVIASDIAPIAEISGGTALLYNPDKPEYFADAIFWLQNKKNRSELIRKGFENVTRFNTKKMTKAYLELFGQSL